MVEKERFQGGYKASLALWKGKEVDGQVQT